MSVFGDRNDRNLRHHIAAAMELLLPRSCVGCGAAYTPECGVLCRNCQQQWRAVPQRISTRVDPLVPLWSLGVLGGVRRQTIINLKEHHRRDVIPAIGAVVAAAVAYLQARGDIDPEIVLVPAPTKPSAARNRGGDVVAAVCQASGLPVTEIVHTAESARESVGLSAIERKHNLSGAVRVDMKAVKNLTGHVLLIDDVATTGATISATVMALTCAGIKVRGALTWAHA